MENKKIPTMFRLDEGLLEDMRTIATIEKRSLNQQVAFFLDREIEIWNMKQDKIREYDNDYEKEEGQNEN